MKKVAVLIFLLVGLVVWAEDRAIYTTHPRLQFGKSGAQVSPEGESPSYIKVDNLILDGDTITSASLDGYVLKTGDTMTGALMVNQTGNQDFVRLRASNTGSPVFRLQNTTTGTGASDGPAVGLLGSIMYFLPHSGSGFGFGGPIFGRDIYLDDGATATRIGDAGGDMELEDDNTNGGDPVTLSQLYSTVKLGGADGIQTIQLDADAETSLEVKNEDVGEAATSNFKVANDEGNFGHFHAHSSAYPSGGSAELLGLLGILWQSGSNGAIIRNTGSSNERRPIRVVLGSLGNDNIAAEFNESGVKLGSFLADVTGTSYTITPADSVCMLENNSGASRTLASTPTITDPVTAPGTTKIGQLLTIIGDAGMADTVLLQDEAILPDSNLQLSTGTVITIGPLDVAVFIHNGTHWLLQSFLAN